MYNRCQLNTSTLTLELCSLSSTAARNSSGTPRSVISPMNLLLDKPVVMVSTALHLSVDLSLKFRYTFFTLTVATASSASFQCSSLKPSWIRREHGRNKLHYHTQVLYQCSMSTVLPVEYINVCTYLHVLESIHSPPNTHTSCTLTGQSTPTDYSYIHCIHTVHTAHVLYIIVTCTSETIFLPKTYAKKKKQCTITNKLIK